jgi:hypothetical protein
VSEGTYRGQDRRQGQKRDWHYKEVPEGDPPAFSATLRLPDGPFMSLQEELLQDNIKKKIGRNPNSKQGLNEERKERKNRIEKKE